MSVHVSVIFGRLSSFVVTITNWKSDDVPRQFGLACHDRLIVVCDTLCATQKKTCFNNGVGSSRSMVFRQFLPRRSQAFKSAELVEVVHIHRQVPTKDSVHRPSLPIISQRVLCPFPLFSLSLDLPLRPSLPHSLLLLLFLALLLTSLPSLLLLSLVSLSPSLIVIPLSSSPSLLTVSHRCHVNRQLSRCKFHVFMWSPKLVHSHPDKKNEENHEKQKMMRNQKYNEKPTFLFSLFLKYHHTSFVRQLLCCFFRFLTSCLFPLLSRLSNNNDDTTRTTTWRHQRTAQ